VSVAVFGIIVCWLLSFLFTGLETGVLTLDRIRLKERVKRRQKSAIILEELLENSENLFATLYSCNSLVQVCATLFYLRWMAHSGLSAWAALILSITYLLGFIIVARLLPKSLFREVPLRMSLLLARPIQWLSIVLMPVVWMSSCIAALVRKSWGAEEKSGRIFATREEIGLIARESVSSEISQEEKQMITGVLDFRKSTVGDMMVSAESLVVVRRGSSPAQVIEYVKGKSVSILPVLDQQDEVVGVISVYDILFSNNWKEQKDLGNYLRRAVWVDKTDQADTTLQRLGASRQRVALVRDEHGKLGGVVTVEDLTEKIVNRVLG